MTGAAVTGCGATLVADVVAINCAKTEQRRMVARATDRLLLALDTSSQKVVCHHNRRVNFVPDARRISSCHRLG